MRVVFVLLGLCAAVLLYAMLSSGRPEVSFRDEVARREASCRYRVARDMLPYHRLENAPAMASMMYDDCIVARFGEP